jgi:hypothetical protein
LLAKSPEYRKNEMVMLEELRRRKKMKDFYDLDTEKTREEFRKDPDRFKKKTGDNFVDKIDDFASPK